MLAHQFPLDTAGLAHQQPAGRNLQARGSRYFPAHRFARDFADALITEAIAASGDGADLGAYTVQCLNGAYLTEGDS